MEPVSRGAGGLKEDSFYERPSVHQVRTTCLQGGNYSSMLLMRVGQLLQLIAEL